MARVFDSHTMDTPADGGRPRYSLEMNTSVGRVRSSRQGLDAAMAHPDRITSILSLPIIGGVPVKRSVKHIKPNY